MKQQGSGARKSRLRRCCRKCQTPRNKLVICIENGGYPASLEKQKLYIVLSDADAEKRGLVRVIDEAGEDYLYPESLFRRIELPPSVKRAVLSAD